MRQLMYKYNERTGDINNLIEYVKLRKMILKKHKVLLENNWRGLSGISIVIRSADVYCKLSFKKCQLHLQMKINI